MKIDVHAHYLPDPYRAALLASGPRPARRLPADPGVVGRGARAAMDRLGIGTSLLSISSPGVHLGDGTTAVDLAREVNEAGRRAVVDHPGRFGLLASLPLPDVDAAMAEIAYCCDHLDVDGFVLLTNVGGTYLGDPGVGAGLPRARPPQGSRVHPPDVAGVLGAHLVRTAPTDARVLLRHHPGGGGPGAQRHDRPPPRHRADRPARGRDAPDGRRPGAARSRCCSGSIPPSTCSATSAGSTSTWPASPMPRQLDALLTMTTLEHLHYGSDYPFTPEFVAATAAERLDGQPGLLDALRANTERLFPTINSSHHERTTRWTIRLELGYLVLEVPDPDTLDPGLRRCRRPGRPANPRPAARTWRNDDRANRLHRRSRRRPTTP